MPDLPKTKVGLVACSGEELPGGTVTRLAALKVLEQLRPADTVTICLPLFLAGGEGDRAFARFYPTVTIDGCELRCAARATELYSGKPAAGVVVTELCAQQGIGKPEGLRRLNKAGLQAVDATAERVVSLVDGLLEVRWSRREGKIIAERSLEGSLQTGGEPVSSACACGSGVPVQGVRLADRTVTLIALPLIFERYHQEGKVPNEAVAAEILETVKVYNPIAPGEEEATQKALLQEYAVYCASRENSP